jgi:AraC family transcriptional regulator
MNVGISRVGVRAHLDVLIEHLAEPECGDSLLLLSCSAGSTITTPAGVAGLWWPIRGRALALTSDSRTLLDRRSIFVSDSHRSQDILFQPSSGGVGLIGTQAAWATINSFWGMAAVSDPALFPALHLATPSVCRQLLRFVRGTAREAPTSMDPSNTAYLTAVIDELQQSFPPLISKCPGRSSSRQRTVFMRLQRVRNYLSCCTEPNLDVRKLAMMANYSVWRFIRVYFSVFGETPYAHISRCRLDRARKLLEASRQCVGDIALAVGFENRSTLTRAMKKRYGLSATQLRLSNESVPGSPNLSGCTNS